MANYAQKEEKILEKIGKEIEKLETTVGKMEDTESKVKHFFEQEKGLHEVKSIIRKVKKIGKLEDKEDSGAEKEFTDWLNSENSLVGKIDDKIESLEKTLDGIGDDDGKVKSFLEQKKVIHEIKSIVHSVDKI